jgi:hypothetical protein
MTGSAAGLKRQTGFWAAGFVLALGLALPCQAQNYQQPPPQAVGPPILMQQAPPDPRQFCYYNGQPYSMGSPYPEFCYYNGQPYSMGSPYPANTPGPNGRPMRCRATPAMVNGYIMMEWSDEN